MAQKKGAIAKNHTYSRFEKSRELSRRRPLFGLVRFEPLEDVGHLADQKARPALHAVRGLGDPHQERVDLEQLQCRVILFRFRDGCAV